MILNKLTKNYLKKNVSGYVSKDQENESLSKYLRLDLGENLLGCSSKVLNCLKNLSIKDLIYYTDPSASKIKEIISNLYSIKKENVTIANSSNEIIDYLPKIIINPKDKVLIIAPTFFRFIEASLAAGGKIIYDFLKEENNYQYTDSLIEKVINKINRLNIKLLWLCNPNNPTGSILAIKNIEKILKKTKAVVILDEAFYEFYDLKNENSGISLINKYKNLIVIRTLSKAYGLAGLRFGYALAHKKTVEIIEKCRNTLLMTSSIIQKLAIAALEDQDWLKKTVSNTKKFRQIVLNRIKKINNLYLANDSVTNFYLLKHKSKDLYQELKEKGILTADFRNAKGLEGKKYVRITVGNKKANQTLLSILNKI